MVINVTLCSAVGNVSDYRCSSDCRSRGRKLEPGPVHTFEEIDHEIISTVILLPSVDSFKKGCCHKLLVNCMFKLVQVMVWLGELTVPHDHIYRLGRKATKQINKTQKPIFF